jgi:hypothetical protein
MPKRNLHVAAKKARMPSSCGTEGTYNLLTKLVDSRIPTGMKRAEQTVPADDDLNVETQAQLDQGNQRLRASLM